MEEDLDMSHDNKFCLNGIEDSILNLPKNKDQGETLEIISSGDDRNIQKNKKFEVKKVLELPWVFWAVLAFSLLETSTAFVFTQNATEFAEHRFKTDSITAGWYSSVLQYAGFFLVPLIGVFVDLFGNRISLSKFS